MLEGDDRPAVLEVSVVRVRGGAVDVLLEDDVPAEPLRIEDGEFSLAEYEEFLAMVEEFPRTHLDTTMAFTSFFEDAAPYPLEDVAAALALSPGTPVIRNTPARFGGSRYLGSARA